MPPSTIHEPLCARGSRSRFAVLVVVACVGVACGVPASVIPGPDGNAPADGGRNGGAPGSGGRGGQAGGGQGGAGGGQGGQPGQGQGGGPGSSVDGRPGDLAPGNPAVAIDPAGATFTGAQTVTLTAAAGDIHYTVDGSLPTSASPVYRGPLTISGPTILRAFAARPGTPPGPLASASFLPVAGELATWSSNLPVVVLHTHQQGPLPAIQDGPFFSGSMILRQPAAGGRASLVGPAALSARAGLRVRGASSVVFPQKSYSVELRQAGSDEDEARALLGLAAESDFALVGAAFMDRSLIRNALAYAISNSIGRWAPGTRFVEVFLVESGQAVRAADYRGVYTLAETIKRDPGRVNIAKLGPTALEPPLVTGGYIVRIDKGMAHFAAGSHGFQYVYPDWDVMVLPERSRQRSYIEGQLRELMQALARPDFKHAVTGKHYRDYLDVPSFIDHNLINALMKNVDALRISAYFHKPLAGPVHAGPVWDFDRSSGTPQDDARYPAPRALEPREWARDDATHPLLWGFWARLFADPEFKAAYGRRFAELVRGPFSVATIHALVDRLAGQLGEAQARHFARWPQMLPAAGSHAAEVAALKDWFSARVPWLQSQL